MFYIKIQLITDNFLLEKGTQKILNHLLEIKLNNYSKYRNLKFYSIKLEKVLKNSSFIFFKMHFN